MKTQQEKREERRQNGLREVERQIRKGSPVVRQMTAAERAAYPACETGRQGNPDTRADPVERDHRMRISDLEAEDRYHRERYALYRAKVYGPRATSPLRSERSGSPPSSPSSGSGAPEQAWACPTARAVVVSSRASALALQPGRQPRSDGRRKRSRRGRGEEPRRKAFAVGPATTSEASIFASAK